MDRVQNIMAEALIRSLSMHMEITTIVSSFCVGIDCLSEPFNVGKRLDGVILKELHHNRDNANSIKLRLIDALSFLIAV